jgi:hypothetical protein
MADGIQSLSLSDPATGAASLMTDALTYGAASDDIIRLVAGSNPATPVGGEAPNPIRVQVLAADGLTPVAGASVFLQPRRQCLLLLAAAEAAARCFPTRAGKFPPG